MMQLCLFSPEKARAAELQLLMSVRRSSCPASIRGLPGRLGPLLSTQKRCALTLPPFWPPRRPADTLGFSGSGGVSFGRLADYGCGEAVEIRWLLAPLGHSQSVATGEAVTGASAARTGRWASWGERRCRDFRANRG